MRSPFRQATAALALLTGIIFPSTLRAATATFASPALDQWVYSNFSDPGGRDNAPTFSAGPGQGVDDRFGMMLTAFQTSTSIPSGQGAVNYEITSVKLTLTVLTGDTFLYDGTYDSLATYVPGGSDTDPGRPIEVFGVGLQPPYTGFGTSAGPTLYGESSPISGPSGRYTYPLARRTDGQLFNAANNVTGLVEAFPFAVGQADLDPGDSVPADEEFVFTIDIASPSVLAYIRNGLNTGFLGFMASSLHVAEGQSGALTYPRLYTKEGAVFAPEFAPKLEVQYVIVPEPRISGLLIVGAAIFAAGRGLRHRQHLS